MAFYGKPVRRPIAGTGAEAVAGSSNEDAVPAKIRHELSRFELSIKDMQTSLRSLNEALTDVFGKTLPRANEFQRALQDENTILDNFARDVHGVEEPLRRYEHQYSSGGSSDNSGSVSANRKSEFVNSVLGTLFKGQEVFFSESFMVSKVIMDIVSQTKYLPTPRQARLAKELAEEISVNAETGQSSRTPAGPVSGGVFPFTQHTGGHRGPGSLIGGAYGSSQQPQSRSVKPASRFGSPQSTKYAPSRIYV